MSAFKSGNWLMTAKRRAKEGILQAVGAHQATEDLEFDLKLRNFTTHVNELNKIKEAMDLWVESYDTFCTSTFLLNDAFKSFFSQSPFKISEDQHFSTSSQSSSSTQPSHSVYLDVSLALDKIILDINQTIQPSIRETFVNRCLKPTISILSTVPAINEQVQERKTAMLDFDSYKAKIQKEHTAGRDSAHPNVVKKAQKLDDSAKKLFTIRRSIVSAIDEYEAARPIMLGAEFSAFVACLYQQSSHTAELTAQLLPMVPQTASSLSIMDSFVIQQQHIRQQISDVGTNTCSISAVESQLSTQFIRELREKSPSSCVNPILTRSEYLGGSFGGYSTGGPLRPTRSEEDGAESDDEDEEIRVASAHLLIDTPANSSAEPALPPLVEAVVIPLSSPVEDELVTATNTEDSHEQLTLESPAQTSETAGFYTAVDAGQLSPDSTASAELAASIPSSPVRPVPPAKPPKTIKPSQHLSLTEPRSPVVSQRTEAPTSGSALTEPGDSCSCPTSGIE